MKRNVIVMLIVYKPNKPYFVKRGVGKISIKLLAKITASLKLFPNTEIFKYEDSSVDNRPRSSQMFLHYSCWKQQVPEIDKGVTRVEK